SRPRSIRRDGGPFPSASRRPPIPGPFSSISPATAFPRGRRPPRPDQPPKGQRCRPAARDGHQPPARQEAGKAIMAKTNPLGFRIEPELKDALVRAAKDDRRSVSSMVEIII